jgi:3-oxoacyl-[acyl-carrier protein] reductase
LEGADLEQKLAGKVALVTGSGRGLGRAYAMHLARLGADVIVHDINAAATAVYGEGESAEEVAQAIRDLGRRSLFIAADVADSAQVDAAVREAVAALGRIDILVNNAGGDIAAAGGKPKPNDCLEIPERDLHAVLDRNLLGTMNVCRAVAPGMMERREGRIVNVASVAGLSATMVEPIYAVAKAGIIHYTRCLAAQLRPYGINVNCISPGGTRSARFLADRPQLTAADLTPKSRLERLGEPEDMAKVIEFLVTDLSDFVTGQNIKVDGRP